MSASVVGVRVSGSANSPRWFLCALCSKTLQLSLHYSIQLSNELSLPIVEGLPEFSESCMYSGCDIFLLGRYRLVMCLDLSSSVSNNSSSHI